MGEGGFGTAAQLHVCSNMIVYQSSNPCRKARYAVKGSGFSPWVLRFVPFSDAHLYDIGVRQG